MPHAPTDRRQLMTDTNRWRTRRASQIYRDLCRLLKALHEAQLISQQILDGGHGTGCKCGYCRHEIDQGDVQFVLDAVAGSRWPIDQTIALVRDNA
jgi:hypothetical protein